jgi:hypothetical protein
MQVTVERYINDVKVATASNTVQSVEELNAFLTKMRVKKDLVDLLFDFDLYNEKTYTVFEETADGHLQH